MPLVFRLVIPAFRELHRLPDYLQALRSALGSASYATEILIVDDGSPEKEQKALRAKIEVGSTGNCLVREPLTYVKNQGKGGAILSGWRNTDSTPTWLAFVDADGAIPAREVRRVFDEIHLQGAPDDVFFSIRVTSEGKFVDRPLIRSLAGSIFRLCVRAMIDPNIQDSQCGFKIIPARYFPALDQHIVTSGLCFDVELLAVLRYLNLTINQIHIEWKDCGNGHVNVFYHSPMMFRELLNIRRRGQARLKNHTPEPKPCCATTDPATK